MEQNVTDSWAWKEMQGARIPDGRQRANLVRMCLSLEKNPELSFSSACGSAVRKAASRLFSNEKSELLSGHFQQTAQRAKAHDIILIAEDTTDINYSGHKASTGLGRLGGSEDVIGLCMHSCLVITPDNQPLGLIAQYIWAPSDQGRKHRHSTYALEKKESYRWVRMLDDIDASLKDFNGIALVLCDREADFYEHFLRRRKAHLLVRAHHLHRKLIYRNNEIRLKKLISQLPVKGTVKLNVKSRDRLTGHWIERRAKMQVKFASVKMPASDQRHGEDITLSIVISREVDAPAGVKPFNWVLYSTLPVSDFGEACEMLRHYSRRWAVERFHYVQHQGLQIERLQFDNFTRLSRALEVCSVVAYRLMWLEQNAKTNAEDDAENYFEKDEMKLLQQLSTKKKVKTLKDAVQTIASLVGFEPVTKQPLPGLKIFWRAWRTFTNYLIGYLLSTSQNCGTG